MFKFNKFPRFLLALILLIGLCASPFAPNVDGVEAKPFSACPDPIITQWTFTNTVASATGAGTFSSGSGLVPSTPPPYTFLSGTAISFSGLNTPALDTNAYLDFAVDTSGRSEIFFNFDYRSTSTGPTIIEIHYSTDGTNYSYFSTEALINDATFQPISIDLSSIPALDNNSNARFRIYGYAASGAGGTLAIDNAAILGTCPYTPLMLLINEVAWAGTVASSDDEWIELYNPGTSTIDVTNWRLVADDGSPDITLSGTITAGGFYLLERGHAGVTNQPHDLIFFGTLDDTNKILRLRAPDGTVVDTANSDAGTWPAGILSPATSMERVGAVADGNLSWSTFQGVGIAIDAGGNLINGTPRSSNNMLGITPTFTPSITPSPTNTFTPTPTLTPTRTITPTPSNVRSVVINEIAWAGTASGLADDEWIELYNTTSTAIDITDWYIKATDSSPNIILDGVIPAGGYFILEKDDDNTVKDSPVDIVANQIYTSNTLSNSGESLTLYDASNKIIDTANGNGGSWPAGSSSTYGTMERISGTTDSDSAWVTNTGIKKNGKNANGGDILGTPKQSNTVGPTPTPNSNKTPTPGVTAIPPRPIINEILARPGFDWNQDGQVNVFDEFIEIKNLTAIDITLNGWRLDRGAGSTTFALPNVTLRPNERIVFYSLETNLLLSDGGETIRLINSSGKIYDAYTYTVARAEDQSFCRLPDGNASDSAWFEDCIPTPTQTNTREGNVPTAPDGNESTVCNLPDTIPADFFTAECKAYGNNIWNPFYWDDLLRMWIQTNTSKWETYFE